MEWDRVDYVKLAEDDTKDKEFWITMFTARPEMLYDLLYDIFATKKGKLGKGRRKRMNGSLDELWSLVYGEENQ
jgi:hypothetical protein